MVRDEHCLTCLYEAVYWALGLIIVLEEVVKLRVSIF